MVYPRNIPGLSMANIETKIKSEVKLSEPPMFKVIYINDDQTPMEFVVTSLIEYFDYTVTTAEKITVDIHESGSSVVAV
jgi:ATP-dependent Clp protease adaptor protein ClpS